MALVLLVSDLGALRRDIVAMLDGPQVEFVEVATGPEAIERVRAGGVDLVITDLQVGAMGGMAITMDLRHGASYGDLPPVKVIMLLDRRADVFLAQRAGADGYVVKPLDAQRTRRAVRSVLAGENFFDTHLQPATVRAGE